MALYYIAAFTAVRALPSAFDRARSAEKDFDVLRHTGGSDGPRVLFVGGNPGVARFYAAAAQELADATSGDVAVLGLRGFVDGRRVSRNWWGDATRWALNRPRGPFSVEEQIAHVADHIDGERALAEGQGRRLVVVGHSIGGYFALKAQRDVPVVCVTPYLENREADPAFRKLRRLVTSPLAPVLASALASVATVLGIVPRVVRRRILRAAGATAGMDSVHEDVTAETMCGFGNVVTMLGLARDALLLHGGEGDVCVQLIVAQHLPCYAVSGRPRRCARNHHLGSDRPVRNNGHGSSPLGTTAPAGARCLSDGLANAAARPTSSPDNPM